MKKGIFIVIVIGMLGWAVFDYISSSTNDDDNSGETTHQNESIDNVEDSDEIGLERGQIAPDFTITTLDGEEKSLSDYRGERIMLNFWATWCPPCRAEMPDMQKVYEQEDVTILAVNMTETETNKQIVDDFVEDFNLTFPILMDEESDVMTSYNIQAYPTSYMIDSNGRILAVTLGAMNQDQMIQIFNKME